ncbi:uncharacterized protein LOC119181050 [Rhipicephalus microplus]|uniref:uncharacterized protein LOC119181050 n=1 Tax=Rhipicephalus microplus TaxID=6941 RepID=UPI001886D275|nr:apoptosis regulatory protein Siva-like [Rhipicephalus microplus]
MGRKNSASGKISVLRQLRNSAPCNHCSCVSRFVCAFSTYFRAFAMKRANPFADDVPIQSKIFASEREVEKNCEKRMSAVYSRTLRMLYSASHQRHENAKPERGQANEAATMDTQPQQCGACHRNCTTKTSCTFCDRPSCDSCTRMCASCEKPYCTLCSVLRYTQQGEYATCLSCGN